MVLTLPMESLLDDAVIEGLSKHFGDRIASIPQEQLMTLALAYSEEEVSNERLHYALNMHQADITKMLGKMCSQRLLESTGRGRGTKYHVFGIELIPPQKVATSGSNVATSKNRYSREELRKKIVDYCSEWRTLDDISFFIERDRNYLRNKNLPQMTDVIEKMYEDIPNHPRQKYKVRQKEC